MGTKGIQNGTWILGRTYQKIIACILIKNALSLVEVLCEKRSDLEKSISLLLQSYSRNYPLFKSFDWKQQLPSIFYNVSYWKVSNFDNRFFSCCLTGMNLRSKPLLLSIEPFFSSRCQKSAACCWASWWYRISKMRLVPKRKEYRDFNFASATFHLTFGETFKKNSSLWCNLNKSSKTFLVLINRIPYLINELRADQGNYTHLTLGD